MVWEWRGFVAGEWRGALPFPGLEAEDADGPREEREDLYLLAPGLAPARNLKLREGTRLELKVRVEEAPGGLERWEKVFAHDLPVPPWEARELAKRLLPGGRVPVRGLEYPSDVRRFVAATGFREAREQGVRKRLRRVYWRGAIAELGALELAPGGALAGAEVAPFTTLALESPERADVEALLHEVASPAGLRLLGYSAFLAGLAPG
ncbi:MAG: hypothetical protein AB7N76_04485 [Planctomycetota bacterium]